MPMSNGRLMRQPELLFAHWAVRSLKDARGPRWRKLVQGIAARPETDADALAFQLTMVRLNGCVTCDVRKYTERGGCARCASTNLGFSKETEESLLARYRLSRKLIAGELKAQRRQLAKAA
jgi:hypothetical protein